MKERVLSYKKVTLYVLFSLLILFATNFFAMTVHASEIDTATGLTINDNGQYEIQSADDYIKFYSYLLQNPYNTSNFKDKTVILTTNIDLTDISINIYPKRKVSVSDISSLPFSGTFNGNGHTVTTNGKAKVTYQKSKKDTTKVVLDNVVYSFIPVLEEDGVIENLKINVTEDIDSTGMNNGGAGGTYGIISNSNSGTILACEIAGKVCIDNQSFYSSSDRKSVV